MPTARKSLCVGIAGGSGSGKSRLARFLKRRLGPRAVVLCMDWYYRDHGGLPPARAKKLNFDHPSSIEMPLLLRQLDELRAGWAIDAPRYLYATHARLKDTRRVRPAPLVILDGLLVLCDPQLLRRLDYSVFIEVPDDVRLLRRIRRDVEHRRIDLEETLRLYERFVRPMHQKHVQPSAERAAWRWRQLEDKGFPSRLATLLRRRVRRAGPSPSRRGRSR